MGTFRDRCSSFVVLFAIASVPLSAGTMQVAWDPVPGAAGYKLHYGTSANEYESVIDVGNTTQATLMGIRDCVQYHVAATAYNAAGESPHFSNEVTGWAKPVVSTGAQIRATQGDQITLDVDGSNFQSGAQFVVDTGALPRDRDGSPLVRVENAAILDCRRAQALVHVEPAGPGARAMQIGTFALDVRVVNPDGTSGTHVATLAVDYDPSRSDLNRSDATTRDRVDGKDLAWLAYSHGSGEDDPRWNPDADLSGDGFVDGQDLALLAIGFGRCWNGSAWSAEACP